MTGYLRSTAGRLRDRLGRRLRERSRDERGAAAIFLVMFAVVMFGAAGLVVDGGQAINARMRVADDAEQASRAGAGAIDVDHLRETGRVRLDATLAAQEAAGFLNDLGYSPAQYGVTVTAADQVQVLVRERVETDLLLLVGVPDFDLQGSAESSPETG